MFTDRDDEEYLLPIYFAPMLNPHHLHYLFLYVDLIKDSIISNSYTPIFFRASDLVASRRSWILL